MLTSFLYANKKGTIKHTASRQKKASYEKLIPIISMLILLIMIDKCANPSTTSFIGHVQTLTL